MEALKQLIPTLVTLSLALMVLAPAMASSRGEFLYVLKRPALLTRSLIAIDVIPVIAAVAVVALFPGLSLPSKAAIILMAVSPVPPLVPGKAMKSGGKLEYVYGLHVAVALTAIISVPLLGSLTAAWYGADARFPVGVIASNVFLGVVLPVIVGILLGRWLAPDLSRKLAPILSIISLILVVLAFLPIIVGVWPLMMGLVGDGTVIAILIVVAIAIIGGHILADRTDGDRATLAFAASMRHPGIALALIGANHAKPALSAGVLLFLLVGFVELIPYQIWLRRTAPPAPAKGERS